MDTVYNLPFEVHLVINPNQYARRLILNTWYNTTDNISAEDCSAIIEENDELDLYFNSTDPSSRLYFDGLECCPATSRIQVDSNKLTYCTPSTDMVRIYRSNSTYDSLRVDVMQITVTYGFRTYFAYLKVLPKQLSVFEWTIMRDDLEKEIRGLAQDIVHSSISIGNGVEGTLPPEEFQAFLIISKNSCAIISALLDIKDRPRYKLQKHYEEADESVNREIDTETVKRYLLRSAPNNRLYVPRRDVVYDIQENRLLKKIVRTYDEKLSSFITTVSASLDYRQQQTSKYPKSLYETRYIERLKGYLETAAKLKKITSVIKSAEWFREVKNHIDAFIPHSVAIDSRYGTLYRTYNEMKKGDFPIQLEQQYSYSWKKSSELYEMWCYIYICRYLLGHYSPVNSRIEDLFVQGHLFPFIEPGTKITVENEEATVEIVYDVHLPHNQQDVKLHDNPLYITGITGGHDRPDICINLYSKMSGWYVGTYIIECKYRKPSAFWESSTWSSREQIIAYHNDSKSPLFLGGEFEIVRSSRPVHQVIVLTPAVFEKIELPDENVTIVTFKPTRDRTLSEDVCDSLKLEIDNKIDDANRFYKGFYCK